MQHAANRPAAAHRSDLVCLCLSVCLQEIKSAGGQLAPPLKDVLVTNIGVNSAANIIYKDEATGATLDRPRVIGSATEGALLIMIKSWGYDDKEVKSSNYSKDTDKVGQAPHLQLSTTQGQGVYLMTC